MTRNMLRLAVAMLAAILLGSVTLVGVTAARSDLQTARAATARFNAVGQATAAGYGLPPAGAPLHECISSLNGTGAMGFHYINGALLDTTVDPSRPEALVYAPDRQGRLKLVALEYVVFQGPWREIHGDEMPTLFGQMFMATGFPNRYAIPAFYSLHVWLWQDNPSGLFAAFNPAVSCGSPSAAGSVALLVAQGDKAPRWQCLTRGVGAA